MSTRQNIIICLTVLLSAASIPAVTYHIDPAAGDIDNNGSAGSPWNTLEAVVRAKTFNGGDSIILHGGHHGAPLVSGEYDTPVIVAAAAGERPVLKTLFLGTARNIHFNGLTITNGSVAGKVVSLGGAARFITVEGCSVYSVSDVDGWSADQWDAIISTGISIAGTNNTIRGNVIKHVKYGISAGATAESTLVEGNHITWYTRDGIRALSNYSTYQYNRFTENIAAKSNHDANAIISWSSGAGGAGTDTVKSVTVRGNLVIDYTYPEHPFRDNPQCMGIGLYDGMFQDWVIENNVICVDMWHGISIYGGIDCRIVNNTVCDMNTINLGPPWIGIFNHKNGTPSSGCIVRNNISNKYTFNGNVTNDHNITLPNVLPYYNIYFEDYAGFDFHLKPGAVQAIDAGSADQAPQTDLEGTVRPAGSGVDIGAYEYAEPTGMMGPRDRFPDLQQTTPAGVYYSTTGRQQQGKPDRTGIYLVFDGTRFIKWVIVE